MGEVAVIGQLVCADQQFFHINVPLGLFFDFHLAGSQSPIGQIPNFLSHHEFTEGLNQGLATAHRNITFVM